MSSEFAVRWVAQDGVEHGTIGLTKEAAIRQWAQMHGGWHLGWYSNLRVERRTVSQWEPVDIPIEKGTLAGVAEEIAHGG